MAIVKIRKAGSIGIVKDLESLDLPPEAWNFGLNCRFKGDAVVRSWGEEIVEDPPTVTPHFIMSSPSVVAPFWVYTDLVDVYAVTGGTHTDITGTQLTGSIDDGFNGGWLNGILVLNNGVDVPQQWVPMETSQPLAALANWSMTGVTTLRAAVIRPFRSFLIALDVTKDGTRFPTLAAWSHPADPGTVPVSWDRADTIRLAGELPIGGTSGFLVDCAGMGAANIVYKQDAVFRMERISSNEVFATRDISLLTGLMGQDCARNFRPGQQAFLTADADVALTDGQQIQEITDRHLRSYLEQNISSEYSTRSFVVSDYPRRLVMVCYPKVGSSYCNEMVVWNWKENTWEIKELTPSLSAAQGPYNPDVDLRRWSDMGAVTWSSARAAVEPWDLRGLAQGDMKLLGAFPLADEIRMLNSGYDRGGVGYTSYVERRGLAIVGQDLRGNVTVDPTKVKEVTKLWPLISAGSATNFTISVGMQDRIRGPIEWQEFPFNTATDQFIEPLLTGRFMAVRFSTEEQTDWKIHGYDVDLHIVGSI